MRYNFRARVPAFEILRFFNTETQGTPETVTEDDLKITSLPALL